MNASVREPDHGPSQEDPLKYAPKKARQGEPAQALVGPPPPPKGDARSEGRAPDTPPAEPPWRRSKHRNAGAATFAGDVAIAELRTKLALAPDRLPEPPPPSKGGSKLVWASRITGVAVVVAVGFMGYRWGSTAKFSLPQQAGHNRPTVQDRTAPDIGNVPGVNPTPAVFTPPARNLPAPAPMRQMTVGAVPPQQADETARLTISAADAGANAAVVITGLAPGATLSVGKEVAPNTWRLSIDDLPGAAVVPPRGFVGIMDLTLELRLPDGSTGDRKSVLLEWLGRSLGTTKPAPRQHDAAEIAQMMKKGQDLMANGDVSSARLMYLRAAEAGEALAAFALAETYDPLVLAKGGIPPDVAQAQAWYAKARDMGAPQASERLERLARSPDQ